MNATRRRYVRALALLTLAAATQCKRHATPGNASLPPLPIVAPAPGTAAIRGRVLHGLRPVAHADVALCREFAHTVGTCNGPHPTAHTDANGAYVFDGLAPGDYAAILTTLDGARATAWDSAEIRTVRAGEVYDAPITYLVTPSLRLIEPADGARLTDARPTFRWSPVAGAAYYRFSVQSRRFDVSRPYLFTRIRINGTSFTATESIVGGEYLWRVEAVDSSDHPFESSAPGVVFNIVASADAGG